MNQTNHKASKEREYLPHHVFLGIIYYTPEGISLGNAESLMHKVLYKLKQKYDSKSNLLDDFTFCTKGIGPISEEWHQTFFGLMVSRMIYSENDKIKKNKDANKSIEDYVLPLFNKKELKQLEMMATDYIKILKVTKNYFEIAK